jgi:hypothetical protein
MAKLSFFLIISTLLLGSIFSSTAADSQQKSANPSSDLKWKTIPVSSKAFLFSPGNWTGDKGRNGDVFRQTWNPGAYFCVAWETDNTRSFARILIDTCGYTSDFKPAIAYAVDGVWKSQIPVTNEIVIEEVSGKGKHELRVYFLPGSVQKERWGGSGKSGRNVLRVTGLQIDPESTPSAVTPEPQWALIIGDSITEGNGASGLSGYSFLVGEALRTMGYEYCISACGWSGWINKGDVPPGDVPGYYFIKNSKNGSGGEYDDSASRWNKIDGNNSLLDSRGKISAYGQTGSEPGLIMINYGTNDDLHHSNPDDTFASMVQCLAALRRSSPSAQIIIIIPFGQYFANELKKAVEIHKMAHPKDKKIAIIDLGQGVAGTLAEKNHLMGGLHPNDRGHANFTAAILPQLIMILNHD